MTNYTAEHMTFIRACREEGLTWGRVAEEFNKQFEANKSSETLKNTYNKRMQSIEVGSEDLDIEIIKALRSARKTNSRTSKVNNSLVDHLITRQNILDEISDYVSKIEFPKNLGTPKPKKKKNSKPDMTMELMISDVHFGKKTDTFNLEVCRDRLKQLTEVFISEFNIETKAFNVHKIMLNFLGDIIENSIMHGAESLKGCEFGNARQVVEAIDGLFNLVVLPISKLGVEIECNMVRGNHDRAEEKKSYHDQGLESLTYIIYKTIEMKARLAKLKNVTFNIPKKSYLIVDVYGDKMLLEHLDQVKGFSLSSLESLLTKRQEQLGHIISFIRGGHWHQYLCSGRGRIIVNESVCGSDDYGDTLGYNSHAGQTINYYIDDKGSRPNCFYKSFPVYLK